jgi:phosphatidylinositol alpha-1,6-mannosyltransferase
MDNRVTKLIISSEFPPGPGGIGQHAASLAMALSKFDLIIVLCNQDYIDFIEKENYNCKLPENLVLYNFTSVNSYLGSFKRIIQTHQLIRLYKPSNVIATGRFQLLIAAMVKILYPKIKVEGFVHGSEVANSQSLYARLTYFSCSRLDKVWAVSSFTAAFLEKHGFRNVEVLPNGLDRSLLDLGDDVVQPLEEWKGFPSLLTAGNVTFRKGQHRVIKALPTLLLKYPELHYHVVGLPTERSKFIELAQSLGVLNSVTFHGRMANRFDLYRAYRSSDIFIMLSENQMNGDVEGFGIALLEANVFKVPTIGASGCGIEDAISEHSGVLVDGDKPEEVLSAIDKILADYTRYQRGSRIWAEEHCWSDIVLRME